jgi:hypothetical protein
VTGSLFEISRYQLAGGRKAPGLRRLRATKTPTGASETSRVGDRRGFESLLLYRA